MQRHTDTDKTLSEYTNYLNKKLISKQGIHEKLYAKWRKVIQLQS